MPKFRFEAVNNQGVWTKGVMEAATFQQAAQELKESGLWVKDLYDPKTSLLRKDITFGGPKVKNEHFTVFCRQLATMYKSGVSMLESIRILSTQSPSKSFRKVLSQVSEEMKRGTQLSVAATEFPTIFTSVFINMIRAGEASGNLDEMLERLAIFYEKEYYTKEKVKSAMIYPIIMGVVMVLVVVFMMLFVIPKYVATFESMNLELPLATRIVISISEFIQGFWYVVIGGAFLPSLILKAVNKSKRGKYAVDYLKLKLPVFGELWHKQAIARFSRTFSSLFAAAIPMLQALTIVSNVVDNEAIKKLILESRETVRAGDPLAQNYEKSWLFPPMVVQMIAIGEKSGALDSMMEKVADFYESDVDAMADRLKSLLEPLMILAISGVVGGIVMAILLPTFKMMENL